MIIEQKSASQKIHILCIKITCSTQTRRRPTANGEQALRRSLGYTQSSGSRFKVHPCLSTSAFFPKTVVPYKAEPGGLMSDGSTRKHSKFLTDSFISRDSRIINAYRIFVVTDTWCAGHRATLQPGKARHSSHATRLQLLKRDGNGDGRPRGTLISLHYTYMPPVRCTSRRGSQTKPPLLWSGTEE